MKIKLPKRFFTPEQLAERWECKTEDITHLIETKLLETVNKLAAIHGKEGIWVIPYTDPTETIGPIPADVPNYCVAFRELREDSETDGDVWERVWKRLRHTGEADPVITAAEVSRFEREHGERTEETAPPPSWPWGDYERPLLRILADAVDHFCVKNDLDRYPKKESGVVINWIMDRMKANGLETSKSLAGAIETLISPRTYAHQRTRKQK